MEKIGLPKSNIIFRRFTELALQVHCKDCIHIKECYLNKNGHAPITKFHKNNATISSKDICPDCEYCGTCLCDLEYQKRQLFPKQTVLEKETCKKRMRIRRTLGDAPKSLVNDKHELIIEYRHNHYYYNGKYIKSSLNFKGEEIWRVQE